MRNVIAIFVYAFLADALLSVAKEWLVAITPVQAAFAWLVFFATLALLALAAFNTRVPKRIVIPAALFLVWAGICGGFPLAFVAPETAEPVLGWIQLFIAIALLALHHQWRRTPPPVDPAWFSWRTFALVTIPTLAAIPFVLMAATINLIGTAIESQSNGYVKLRPAGLMLEERELTKDGRHVRLVSMMHIGDKSFYDQVLASLPAEEIAIVLVEGVTDEKGILKSHFSYEKIARLFGLSSQETSSLQQSARTSVAGRDSGKPSANPKVEYRHADVDVSTFRPLTLQYIGAIGEILSDPTLETISRVAGAPDTPFKSPEVETVVMGDILEKRNEHLVAEVGSALETSRNVVVPWGALHLPYIESELKKQGFQETRRVDRPIIRFWRTSETTPVE